MSSSSTSAPFEIRGKGPNDQISYEWQNSTLTRWNPGLWVEGVYDKRIIGPYPVQPESEPFRLYGLPPELRIRVFTFFCLAHLDEYVEAEKRDLSPLDEDQAIASDAMRRAGWLHYFPELLPCRLVSKQFYREFSETRAKLFTYEMPEFVVADKKFQGENGVQKVASEVMERMREFFHLIPDVERPSLRRAYVKTICASNTAAAGSVVREFDGEELAGLLEKVEGMHRDFRLTVTMTVSKRWAAKQKAKGVKKPMTFKPEGEGWICETSGPIMVSNQTMKKWKVESK